MDRDQTIRKIAAKHLGVGTLETRKSDSLDFHDVAVWSVKAALEAAYEAGAGGGVADGRRTACRAERPMDDDDD